MASEPSPPTFADVDGSTLEPVRPVFRALARTIVPELAGDDPGWAEIESTVDRSLATRPPALRRQFRIFLRLVDLIPIFRWGRTFRGLDAGRRTRVLEGLQRSRLFLLRRGFWSVRTLVYMGHYSRESAYRDVGYRAHLRGWIEHPDATPAARSATGRALGAVGRDDDRPSSEPTGGAP